MKKKQILLNQLHKIKFNLPGHRLAHKTFRSFNHTEKIIFYVLATGLIITTPFLLLRVNQSFLVKVPKNGGMITEGVTGMPQIINPITISPFTSPEADNDLIALIYSGLLKATPDGSLIPDLAESYQITEDGLTYTFILKDNLYWHDGEPVTSDDVKFTIQKAQDSQINSRHKASWDGVTVENPDEKTIIFTLSEPYSPFLQNTTIGIIPKHLWEEVHPESFTHNLLNTKPIGTGPYKIVKIKKDGDEVVEYYDLESFDKYALGRPYIDKIRIKFYANREELITAYEKGEITSVHSVSPEKAKELAKTHPVEQAKIPRVFGAFFNQNEATIFTDEAVREALNIAIDRTEIINNVLYGFATEIEGPIPPGSLGYTPYEEEGNPENLSRIEQAQKILEDDGWTKDEEGILIKETSKENLRLEFSISTTQTPELTDVAQKLKKYWESLGAKVEIKSFETTSDLENYAIRPRKYDILLFGEIIGRDSDPFAFWHSSQRLDPGLNIASYTNIAVDNSLEKARTSTSTEERLEQYKIFQEEIKNDTPAVFIYSPKFIYFSRDTVMGLKLNVLETPSERFLNVHEWYMETEQVWKIFARGKEIIKD